MDKKNYFSELYKVDVNEKTEKKQGLTYLSWAWAWATVKKLHPNATYRVKKFNGLPYMCDDNIGYMVFTEVTIGDITHEMWLPVMDGANKAMKKESYTYITKYNGEKTVEPASMFDVNKTIMRCLTKNLAMHGLGLYIYAGEDLPEVETTEEDKIRLQELVESANNTEALTKIWKENAKQGAWFKTLVANRGKELKKNENA
jgi:hypothetical protein